MEYPQTLHEHVWWAPRRASWWIGVLFAIGSTCFFVGPIFFTSAATLQYDHPRLHRAPATA